MNAEQIQKDHAEFLFPCVTNYYETPLVIQKAQGSTVTDYDGRDYLDFFGGILTVSLEHCHQEVNHAVQAQMQKLGHVSTLYQSKAQTEVAKRLAHMTPGQLQKSFFTNSGTEANETALVLAKVFTKRHEIVVLRHSYAGRSHLALNTTGHAPWRVLESSIPGVKHIRAPYCYRCPYHETYPSCGLKCAHDLEELIQTETSGEIAAFMAEPILGVGGFIVPPDEYFQVVVGIARKYGGVFICDEVQTGFGRTGDKWFGIEHSGVAPDIMTLAKGIANGFPVGATIAKKEIADALIRPSISTFGGNPVCMTAANTTIAVMEREDIPQQTARKGALLQAQLQQLFEQFTTIGEVRGRGLMWGLELVEDRTYKTPAATTTARILDAAKENGLLIGKGGLYGNVLRIAPPMLISEDELLVGTKKLRAAFEKICGE